MSGHGGWGSTRRSRSSTARKLRRANDGGAVRVFSISMPDPPLPWSRSPPGQIKITARRRNRAALPCKVLKGVAWIASRSEAAAVQCTSYTAPLTKSAGSRPTSATAPAVRPFESPEHRSPASSHPPDLYFSVLVRSRTVNRPRSAWTRPAMISLGVVAPALRSASRPGLRDKRLNSQRTATADDHDHTYRVLAWGGAPGQLVPLAKVCVDARTERGERGSITNGNTVADRPGIPHCVRSGRPRG
jgi:hypothetical protein